MFISWAQVEYQSVVIQCLLKEIVHNLRRQGFFWGSLPLSCFKVNFLGVNDGCKLNFRLSLQLFFPNLNDFALDFCFTFLERCLYLGHVQHLMVINPDFWILERYSIVLILSG